MNTYQQLLQTTNENNALLIAVSKTQSTDAILQLYNQGQRHFGENKVQELTDKYTTLPKDIHWHLIGHLQTNKVKNIVAFINTIHSVDSLKLLQEIQKEAAKINRKINVLLQLYFATEETKFGLKLQEAQDILNIVKANATQYNFINICGVMGMASFTDSPQQIQNEFADLKNMFTIIKETYFPFDTNFKEISMGMSSDYKIALEQGSTMVRVGSLLFGERG